MCTKKSSRVNLKNVLRYTDPVKHNNKLFSHLREKKHLVMCLKEINMIQLPRNSGKYLKKSTISTSTNKYLKNCVSKKRDYN